MKTSIIKSVLLFAAGAGCATVVAQASKEVLSQEQFREQAPVLLTEIATIGASVAGISGGRIYLSNNPPIACFPPPNPNLPAGAVSPRLLRNGLEALIAYNEARMDERDDAVRTTSKCHLAADGRLED